MFTLEPLPNYDRSVRCKLLIDGKPLENATVTQDRDGRIYISTDDYEISNQLTSYTLLELPSLEGLSVPYQPDGSELITRVFVNAKDRVPRPTSFDISFEASPDLAIWNRVYGFVEYWHALQHSIESLNNPDIRFSRYDRDLDYVCEFTIEFPFSTPALPIATEISRRSELLRKLHEQVESSLIPLASSKSVAVTFDLPEEVRVPCEQYLLYFVEFLRDLGVNATSELKHQAGKALFTVTPTDTQEALGKIRTALEIYLTLPSSPIRDIPADSGVEIQKLVANLHYLKSQLALSQATLEAKNATIQAQQLTIEVQRAAPGDVVRESVIEITPAASKIEKEDLLGGTLSITKYQGKGFEINLPEIIRRLKNYSLISVETFLSRRSVKGFIFRCSQLLALAFRCNRLAGLAGRHDCRYDLLAEN
jgi:hypothetical protein